MADNIRFKDVKDSKKSIEFSTHGDQIDVTVRHPENKELRVTMSKDDLIRAIRKHSEGQVLSIVRKVMSR